MVQEHERIVLTADLPAQGLRAGDVGTVVHVYNEGRAYEVEFVSLDGETSIVATVESSQLRPVQKQEFAHARQVTSA
jgi:hypothetical protein